MTRKEIDNLELLYEQFDYICAVPNCGKRSTQRAHIIGNTKLNRKLHGSQIIDNPLNWLPVCSLECNKKCDIGRIKSNHDMIKQFILLNDRNIIIDLLF